MEAVRGWIECGTYKHLRNRVLGFYALSHTTSLAISSGAGKDFDTSRADPAESGKNSQSTSKREKPLRDWKSRNPPPFSGIRHLLVRAVVLGETA